MKPGVKPSIKTGGEERVEFHDALRIFQASRKMAVKRKVGSNGTCHDLDQNYPTV